jgi:hypothetical protein
VKNKVDSEKSLSKATDENGGAMLPSSRTQLLASGGMIIVLAVIAV